MMRVARPIKAMDTHPTRRTRIEVLAIALTWLVAAWIVWNLVHWVDPGYQSELPRHSSWSSPRGLFPQANR
jgi:hypothetical protein